MKKLLSLLTVGSLALYTIGRFLGMAPLAALLLLDFPWIAGGTAAFVWFRRVWFFRDPLRVPERQGRVIVSPADGRVMYVERIEDGRVVARKLGTEIPVSEITKLEGFEAGRGWLIGIYMSPGDVHYNYAPHQGEITEIFRHSAAVNLPMVDLWEYISFMALRRAVNLFARRFHFENERTTLVLRDGDLLSAVVLIADKFVNKIRLFIAEHDVVVPSQKLSFISRGSQVDLFVVRDDLRILVAANQQVFGGRTILAEY